MKKTIIIIIIIIDQATKFLTEGVAKDILPFFSITSTTNTGALFGVLKGANVILALVTVLVIGVVVYYYKKEPKLQLGFSLILAGAIGNLLDRVLRGHVLDFLDFKIWPIFNLADAFLTIGVLYCIYILIKEK